MKSTFEVVRSLSSIFRTFARLVGNKGQFRNSIESTRSPWCHSSSRNTIDPVTKQRQQSDDYCGDKKKNVEQTPFDNHSYSNSQTKEASLFAFASSAALIWPPVSNNNATTVGRDGSPPARKTGVQIQQKRFLWGWLNSIFNRVDEARIKEVGPDRACAEWLLRCGAGVKWDKGSDEWLRDYNSLPAGSFRSLKIVEIDATDSAVMHIGFGYLRGLENVRKATFHRCIYLEDEAVRQLGFIKNTLEDLQISSCGNVTDEGILTLVQMKNLKRLKLYDFLEVRHRSNCIKLLKQSLPNCEVIFPFAREADRDPAKPCKESES